MNITTTATRIGLNILALLGATAALYLGQSVFIPVVFAALLAVILWPAARWLHRNLKFPWFFACLTVIGLLVVLNLVVFTGFALAVPQTIEELPNPRNPEQLKDLYKKARLSLTWFVPNSVDRVLPANSEDSTVYSYVQNFFEGRYVTDQLLILAKAATNWFFQSVVVLFILLFLLLEGEYLAARIKEIFGENVVVQQQVAGALAEMADAIRSYLVWRTIVNCGLGLFLGLVYSMFELKQPWTWALLTAVLCYVPYIGTIIAGVPPILDAIIHCSPWHAAGILVFYTVVVTVEGYLIIPLVMGRSMDLNATTVMIACLFWDLVWGTPGLFLAMPLMAGVRAVCLHVQGWRPWANLMSTERGLREAEQDARIKSLSEKVIDIDATVVMDGLSVKDVTPRPSSKG